MEIVNHRRKMLDAVGSNVKGNNNFSIKVISTENVDGKKNMEEVRRKNQTYFFHFLSYYLDRLVYLLWNSIIFLKFWHVIYKEWFFLNKRSSSSSSSQPIYKSILHVIQNTWHGQGFSWILER